MTGLLLLPATRATQTSLLVAVLKLSEQFVAVRPDYDSAHGSDDAPTSTPTSTTPRGPTRAMAFPHRNGILSVLSEAIERKHGNVALTPPLRLVGPFSSLLINWFAKMRSFCAVVRSLKGHL